MFRRFKKLYVSLIVAGLAFFALAWVPNDSGVSWLATIGWFGMMLVVLALVILTLVLGIRAIVQRRTAATGR